MTPHDRVVVKVESFHHFAVKVLRKRIRATCGGEKKNKNKHFEKKVEMARKKSKYNVGKKKSNYKVEEKSQYLLTILQTRF